MSAADNATNNSLLQAENRLYAMRSLYEITKDIVSHLDTKEVIDSILHTAAKGLNTTAADLMMRDETSGNWGVYASHNKLFTYTGIVQPLEAYGPNMTEVLEGKPVIMNDFGSWLATYSGFMDSFITQAEKDYWLSSICLAAPLWRGETVIGLVSVTDVGTARQFTANDADYLALFAGVASVAFANAEAHSRLLRLNEDLEKRVAQRTLQLQQTNEQLEQKTEQLNNALEATIRLQEQERERIANELHDTSCQMVAGALFELQAALESLNAGNTRGTVAKLDTAMQVIRDLDNANRMVMEAAYPSLLNKKGLVSALKYSIKGLNSQFDGSCGLVVKGNPARITQQQELALFRIAQEGVTNALKHAQAKTVSLSLEFYDGRLVMRIYDDGRGFSQRKRDRGAVPHRGIIGIKDRAAAINASLELLSAAGEGTQITVELAYEAAPGAPAAPTSTAPKSSVQA